VTDAGIIGKAGAAGLRGNLVGEAEAVCGRAVLSRLVVSSAPPREILD